MSVQALEQAIRDAFADVEYPGDWCLRGSNEGDEPYRLEAEFRGKDDWRQLAPELIDNAPDGLGSALSFFSDEAFRFYLPAYLIADVHDRLSRADPLFHLTHGLDDESRLRPINPRRFGDRTWLDYKRFKFSIFSVAQARAVVSYLEYKKRCDDVPDVQREQIEQALASYWYDRAA